MDANQTEMPDSLSPDIARVLYTRQDIQKRVAEMAAQIAKDYSEVDSILLVGVLKGAFIFLADLARLISIPHTVDFLAVSSYGQRGAASGAVRLLMDLREPIAGKHVIIVEDIVDTGQTLGYLNDMLVGRRPASLRRCAFLRKERPGQNVNIDYLGFTIPDVWVVGYGLDYADRYRTLPYIAELKPEIYQRVA